MDSKEQSWDSNHAKFQSSYILSSQSTMGLLPPTKLEHPTVDSIVLLSSGLLQPVILILQIPASPPGVPVLAQVLRQACGYVPSLSSGWNSPVSCLWRGRMTQMWCDELGRSIDGQHEHTYVEQI